MLGDGVFTEADIDKVKENQVYRQSTNEREREFTVSRVDERLHKR